MKKFIFFLIVGLFFNNFLFADQKSQIFQDFIKAGGNKGDPGQTQILEHTADYIVVRNKTAYGVIILPNLIMTTSARVFHNVASEHCLQNDKKKSTKRVQEIDFHTVYFVCYQTIDNFYNKPDDKVLLDYSLCDYLNKTNDLYLYNIRQCPISNANTTKLYPDIKSDYEKLLLDENKFTNTAFIYRVKTRIYNKFGETAKINEYELLNRELIQRVKETCHLLGLKKDTPNFSKCGLEVYLKLLTFRATPAGIE